MGLGQGDQGDQGAGYEEHVQRVEPRERLGADFLTSVMLGYELVGRCGLAVGATSHMLRGFYPTGTGAVFGAAAANPSDIVDAVKRLLMPATILGLAGVGPIIRYVRTSIIETLVARIGTGDATGAALTFDDACLADLAALQ